MKCEILEPFEWGISTSPVDPFAFRAKNKKYNKQQSTTQTQHKNTKKLDKT